MQRYLLIGLLLILGVVLTGSFTPLAAQEACGGTSFASPQSCIAALEAEINMAAMNGGIDNEGIVNSLMEKLEQAYDSVMAGDLHRAMNHTMAFMNEVMAQAGKHIMEDVAMELMNGAEMLMMLLMPS